MTKLAVSLLNTELPISDTTNETSHLNVNNVTCMLDLLHIVTQGYTGGTSNFPIVD
jgi:hypothetical protein